MTAFPEGWAPIIPPKAALRGRNLSGTNPMNSSSRNPVYNRRISSMIRTAPPLLRRSCLLVVLLAILNSTVRAANWSSPEQQLAVKIAAVTGPGAVSFDLRNQSSLTKKDTDEISRGLRAQLEAAGLRFVALEQAAASVTVTLSENLQSFVWVAEIRQGTNEPAVVIVSVPRADVAGSLHEPSPLILRKTPLWSQQDRILDVAVFEEMSGQSHLAVLSPEQVSLFRFQDGRWQLDQNMPISHRRPWPRDLRGRMILRAGHLFDAYLPGVFCQSSNGVPITLTCRESDDPWPLGGDPLISAFFAPTRNFFTGALAPGVGKETSTSKFYSAAPIPRGNYALWLFTSVDGTEHLLDGISDQIAHWNWGSDLATINTACGGGWQVLATARGDMPNDSIRAYEFPDRDPIAVSPPIDFSGNVTALWPEAKEKSAIAIAHNFETGGYEAFRLTITCSQ